MSNSLQRLIEDFLFRKTVTSLQERLQSLDHMNKSLMDDSIVQKIRIGQLEDDLNKVKVEKQTIQTSYQAKIDVRIPLKSSIDLVLSSRR